MTSAPRALAAFALLGAPLAMLAASPASAQSVDAARPASLVAALQTAGYKAVLTKSKDGDPKIESSAEGSNFIVLFYGCEEHANCKSLQFAAGYIVKPKPAVTKMNEWNANNRFGQAYLDSDGDPNIDFDVVTIGGMSPALFGASVDRWTSTMSAFQKFIGW